MISASVEEVAIVVCFLLLAVNGKNVLGPLKQPKDPEVENRSLDPAQSESEYICMKMSRA